MNLLDENIPLDQRDILESSGIRCRVIGLDVAGSGIADDNILALLHRLKRPILFSRDRHFFKRRLGHAAYGLVWLDIRPEEAAFFIRRFMRHPRFRTVANRLGIVARTRASGIDFWQLNRPALQRERWLE